MKHSIMHECIKREDSHYKYRVAIQLPEIFVIYVIDHDNNVMFTLSETTQFSDYPLFLAAYNRQETQRIIRLAEKKAVWYFEDLIPGRRRKDDVKDIRNSGIA